MEYALPAFPLASKYEKITEASSFQLRIAVLIAKFGCNGQSDMVSGWWE